MKKYLIKIACILGILFLGVNSVSNVMDVANADTPAAETAGMKFNKQESNIAETSIGSGESIDVEIQTLISRISMFLALIAVILGLYGGFMILTAGLKEENVKKGRTIIVYALVGLVVIFLAYSIVSFVITQILGNTGNMAE